MTACEDNPEYNKRIHCLLRLKPDCPDVQKRVASVPGELSSHAGVFPGIRQCGAYSSFSLFLRGIETNRSPIFRVTPQMQAAAATGPGQSQELKLSPGLHTEGRDPTA